MSHEPKFSPCLQKSKIKWSRMGVVEVVPWRSREKKDDFFSVFVVVVVVVPVVEVDLTFL